MVSFFVVLVHTLPECELVDLVRRLNKVGDLIDFLFIHHVIHNKDNANDFIASTANLIKIIQSVNMVNVMGEVFQPGTYALSSFSTVFHALYRAGGVSDIGSLRNIQVVRGGQKIATMPISRTAASAFRSMAQTPTPFC